MTSLRAQPTAEGKAGRFSLALAGIWLLFLVEPVHESWPDRGEPLVAQAILATFAFATTYLAAFELLRRRRGRLRMDLPVRQAYAILGILLLLSALMCAGFGQNGLGSTIYVAVVTAMALPALQAAVLVPALAGVVLAASTALPGWRADLADPMIVLAAGFVMWGVKQIMARNVDLVLARAENNRLLVEQERNRFGRDLHDILGHSLTVITVKAELARRLLDIDSERAGDELADLERLSREALADVRRAVQGYRELTLPGEIARARLALESAGITAELPGSAEHVQSSLHALFAWTIREAVTNVIRHSNAASCTVHLSANKVRVVDDGQGASAATRSWGSGLAGLRERAVDVGAVVSVRGVEPCGFAVEVVGPG